MRDVTEVIKSHANSKLVEGLTTIEVIGSKAAITTINKLLKTGKMVTRTVHNGNDKVLISFIDLVRN